MCVTLGPTMSMVCRLYVDGRLESAIAKRTAKVRRTDRPERKQVASKSPERRIEIGGRVLPSGNSDEYFRGLMDELFVASRPLTPPEIRQLQRENRPAPMRTVADANGVSF